MNAVRDLEDDHIVASLSKLGAGWKATSDVARQVERDYGFKPDKSALGVRLQNLRKKGRISAKSSAKAPGVGSRDVRWSTMPERKLG